MERVENKWLTIMSLCLGTLFICFEGGVIQIALILSAIILTTLGLMEVFEKRTTTGLIMLGLGIISGLFAWVPALGSAAIYLLAVLLILLGLYEIIVLYQGGLKNKSTLYKFTVLVVPVLCIVAGILLFFNASWSYIAIGVLLILVGLINFCQLYLKGGKK